MDNLSHTTTDAHDQAEENILAYTVSDEALEAAAGTEIWTETWPRTVVYGTLTCC
jgi:hypothetical protein